MSKSINKSFFVILISTLLYIWLSDKMLSVEMRSFYISSGNRGYICGVVLSLLSVLYFVKKYHLILNIKSKEKISFVCFLCYFNFISFLIGIFSVPFDTSMILGLLPLFLFLTFFSLMQNAHLSQLMAICMSLVLLALFYNYNASLTFIREAITDDSLSTSGTSYYILFFIPFSLCLKNKFLSNASMLIGVLFIMTTGKRGIVVAFLLMVIIYYLIYIVVRNKKKDDKNNKYCLKFFVFGVIILFVFCLFFDFFAKNNSLIVDRLLSAEKDGGSGRLQIWTSVLEMIFTSNLVELIFGHGYLAVASDSIFHLTAHNDYLEILYDYGLIGFFLFIKLIIVLIKFNKKLINICSDYAAPFAASITIFVVVSFVSNKIIKIAFIKGNIEITRIIIQFKI